MVLLHTEAALRVLALPSRLRMAAYLPPHMRLSLDEPALLHSCLGGSSLGRALGLAMLHAGPVLWLSLCFQLGELYGKLECPWEWRRLRLLGRMFDFSFGADEPPPAKLTRAHARQQWVVCGLAIGAAWLVEWLLVGLPTPRDV